MCGIFNLMDRQIMLNGRFQNDTLVEGVETIRYRTQALPGFTLTSPPSATFRIIDDETATVSGEGTAVPANNG